MTTDTKKNIAICVLLIISISLAYFVFKKPAPAYDQEFIQAMIDSSRIKSRDAELRAQSHIAERNFFKHQYDSILLIPAKIKIQYVPIYKKLDNAGVNALIASSDSIFANNGVK